MEETQRLSDPEDSDMDETPVQPSRPQVSTSASLAGLRLLQ